MRRLTQATLLVALHAAMGAQALAVSTAVADIDDADAREVGAAAGKALYLIQPLTFGFAARSVVIAVDFSPAAWRVGSPVGPAATEAQLKSVFMDLKHIIVAGRCSAVVAAATASHRPCAFALGRPDFAGIVNPDVDNAVFGWVATAPATTLGTGDTASTALRYFGLLSPMRYTGRAGSAAMVALRYHEAASMQLPSGFDRGLATLIIHNDRLAPQALQTPGGHEALVQRMAGR